LLSAPHPGSFSGRSKSGFDRCARLLGTFVKAVEVQYHHDIAREVPVISLASGRVVDIKARLDDSVKKGQHRRLEPPATEEGRRPPG
jgi:hypothetical protein